MTDPLWQTLILTFQLATATTLILLLLGTPIAWHLARSHSRVKPFIEAVIAMPLVLPPSVLGYYLLVGFAPDSLIGGLWQDLFDQRLAFSFEALVMASVIYSAPFVIQPMINAFQTLSEGTFKAAASLGCNGWQRFVFLALPMTRTTLVSAAIMGFAHTVGEFGVVLMIGGNIPGETQVMSIALYQEVEMLNYDNANRYAAMLLGFSAVVLVAVYSLQARAKTRGLA
ncbi:MAG TPA: molybdate ABC transporter permease subunit [Pseudomonadales bacterium]|nr:molybdate ABC transporter permease subunit [Pseudomonadales bacterium]